MSDLASLFLSPGALTRIALRAFKSDADADLSGACVRWGVSTPVAEVIKGFSAAAIDAISSRRHFSALRIAHGNDLAWWQQSLAIARSLPPSPAPEPIYSALSEPLTAAGLSQIFLSAAKVDLLEHPIPASLHWDVCPAVAEIISNLSSPIIAALCSLPSRCPTCVVKGDSHEYWSTVALSVANRDDAFIDLFLLASLVPSAEVFAPEVAA